jgi:single-stranded DNA-binding protein
MNSVQLVGSVGLVEPLQADAAGRLVVRFRIGTQDTWVDRSGDRQQRSHWHTVRCFGRTAEALARHLALATLVGVHGRVVAVDLASEVEASRVQVLALPTVPSAPFHQDFGGATCGFSVVNLVGRVGHLDRVHTVAEGRHMLRLRVATEPHAQRGARGRDAGDDWHTIKVFDRAAIGLAKRLRVGEWVSVQGRLVTWESDGREGMVERVEVEAFRVRALGVLRRWAPRPDTRPRVEAADGSMRSWKPHP